MDKIDKSLFFVLIALVFLYSFSLGLIVVFILLLFGVVFFRVPVFAVFLLLLLVVCRFYFYTNFEYNTYESLYVDNQVYEINVRICGEPDIRLQFVNYLVCINDIDGSDSLKFHRRMLLKASLYPKYAYGDELSFFAKIEEPFESEDFSYKEYLKIFKVDALLKPVSDLELTGENDSLMKQIYKLKFYILGVVESNLNEPYASLINGILLGSRKGFSDELTDMLAITGLTHIVAVSGYNVSMVILFIDKLLFFVPRNVRFYFLVIAILIFAILAGLSASVLRACIMGVLSVVVLQYGYSASVLRSLLLTAVGMALYNPAYLFVDLGFQLSFFATFGVLFLSKYISISFLPEKFGFREAMVLTLSAQITTLPTILFYFGTLSIVSPVINVIVAPLLPLMMFLGFVLVLINQIDFLSLFIVYILSTLNYLFFIILKFFAKFPFAAVEVGKGSLVTIGIIYIMIFLFIFRKGKCFDQA